MAEKTKASKKKSPKVTISEAPKTIYDFLFAFNSENIVIPRNGNGVSSKGVKYKYATLDDVINITRPFLQKHGLMFTQTVAGTELKTTLVAIHATAEPRIVESAIPLGKPESAQDMGTRITYMRRYALVPALGLSIEEDTDAIPAELNKADLPADPLVAPVAVSASANPVIEELKQATETILNAHIESPTFIKATGVIESCQTIQALEVVKDRIVNHQVLTADEKARLGEIIKSKETKLVGTIH